MVRWQATEARSVCWRRTEVRAPHSADILVAWQHLDEYLDALVASRRRSTADDLFSELIRAEVEGAGLGRREIDGSMNAGSGQHGVVTADGVTVVEVQP